MICVNSDAAPRLYGRVNGIQHLTLCFYRGDATITRLDELRYKRRAVGRPGNGGRLIVEPLLKASNVTPSNTSLVSLGGTEALRALRGATTSPIIWQALHDGIAASFG